MSDKNVDDNKRTCIICGCHTNQTINIYEPRSGPNIVQLIQARFKFQPLNDDKYLCYSCNNWLINWHSLQAVNSNNTNNPRGNCRKSMNNAKSELNTNLDVKSNIVQCSKPIAIVKPCIREQPNQPLKKGTPLIQDKSSKSVYSKLEHFSFQRQRTSQRKLRSSPKVLTNSSVIILDTPVVTKYENSLYTNTSPDINLDKKFQDQCQSTRQNNWNNLVSKTSCKDPENVEKKSSSITLPYLPRKGQGTSIDGRVVSMLRRIGTTLSRDFQCASNKYEPSKRALMKNTQTLRQDVVDDEILINFNTAISEVLYYNKKNSAYDIIYSPADTIVISSSDDENVQDVRKGPINVCKGNPTREINLERVFKLLPKGLSVSLITDSC